MKEKSRDVQPVRRPAVECVGGGCQGGAIEGVAEGFCAGARCSPVTAPRGGSMLLEGTDPSEQTRIQPSVH